MGNIVQKEEGRPTELATKVVGRLKQMKMHKAELALAINMSRALVSQYLSGKYKSDPTNVEAALTEWLAGTEEEHGTLGEATPAAGTASATPKRVCYPKKTAYFHSADYVGVMSVCQSCQEDMGLGIIVGRSGFGKTHALKNYARLPRVAYLECDDTMSCRDLIEALETQLGMAKASGGTIWKRTCRIREFLNVNAGYLIIVDEADKLINKYTAAKMEILRGIFDQADVGVVVAGEPRLEGDLKSGLARFANRVDFYYKLHGLDEKELGSYLEGWDVTQEAAAALAERAFAARNGSFRLLDRTLNNVLRVLRGRGEAQVTLETVREASGMMML